MDNDLYEALIGAELSGRELRVALAIHRLTAGFNKESVKVAALYIAKMMYSDESKASAERANVSRAINSLIRQRVLYRAGGSRDPIGFAPVSEWKLDQKSTELKSTQCVENYTSTVLKITHIKERNTFTTSNEVVVDAQSNVDQVEQPKAKVVRQKPQATSCPTQSIVDLYHEILPELPSVLIISDTRRRTLATRWKENAAHQEMDFWREYFQTVKASKFLTGNVPGRNGGKPFRASFDWLINSSNFVKVVEGNYNA